MLVAWLTLFAAPAWAQSPYAHWAAVVVAGDDQAAHTDQRTKAFDNARRDITTALERRGFSAANLAQFSADPAQTDANVQLSRPRAIARALGNLAARAADGCLVYITSHGDPDGVAIGETVVSPNALARLIERACPNRPVVAVISACFSGVFVPALRGPDRLVVTAARSDRSSFGCGESDRYPYFDACVLRSLDGASGFLDLGPRARECVARREREERVGPPSEPQISAGDLVRRRLAPFGPVTERR